MSKNIKKTLYIVLTVCLAMCCFSCKKKRPMKLIELDKNGKPVIDTPVIATGVHPERGYDRNAVQVKTIPILKPTGRDKTGKQQYTKIIYEVEESQVITADDLDLILKNVGLIGEDSLFCDLVITDAGTAVSAGPGSDAVLTKKGLVRYVDLSSPLDNSDDYEGKVAVESQVGMITQTDIEHCITETFMEYFQLVSCDIEPVGMDIYNQVHGK